MKNTQEKKSLGNDHVYEIGDSMYDTPDNIVGNVNKYCPLAPSVKKEDMIFIEDSPKISMKSPADDIQEVPISSSHDEASPSEDSLDFQSNQIEISDEPLAYRFHKYPNNQKALTDSSHEGSLESCGDTLEETVHIDSGLGSVASSWDRTMAKVKEHAYYRLQDELDEANEKLKLRDEEVSRLSRIRTEVEAELEDLTASLFQEAHNMVREANIRQASAERALKESHMKVEVLTAEVAALKTLVITSTPSRPNPHLHPQIKKDDGGLFRKHHRSPSDFNLNYGKENSPPESPSKDIKLMGEGSDFKDGALEVDPVVHKEFFTWKESPTLEKNDPFIDRMYREDINICLDFVNKDLSEVLKPAIESGEVFIEAVCERARNNLPKKCALLEAVRQCQYRLRIGNSNTWYSISHMCRNRIIAVCDFLNYLRYIQRGLVKSSAHEVYWEIVRLRKEMSLARLGLSLSS